VRNDEQAQTQPSAVGTDRITRRTFLIGIGLTPVAVALLSGCQAQPPAAAPPTQAASASAPTSGVAAGQPAPAAPQAAPVAPAAPKAGSGDITVALSAQPTSMHPVVDTVKTSFVIQTTMMEPLVRNTPDLKFVPSLAESWEFVPPRQWRVKLRRGVKFHNGEDFNAQAVQFADTVYKNTKGNPRAWYDFLEEVKTVDDYTVDFVTKTPTSVLPASLSYFFPFPPKYYEQVGADQFG
jgi:ABC-type transport system substrate-binding protein